MKEIIKMVEKLQALTQKKADLLQQLSRSVALLNFYPGAFKHGACSTSVYGNTSQFKAMVYKIRLGNGVVKEWPLSEVPASLLHPATVRQLRANATRITSHKLLAYLKEGQAQ
jgi:hypothetical protein